MRNIREMSFGQVWRVHSDGQSPAEVWSADPLLQHSPNPEPGIPGPNGFQVFDDEVYVSVSTRDHVVALPINEDGSAGAGRVHVMFGADDFAFDKNGKREGHRVSRPALFCFLSKKQTHVTENGNPGEGTMKEILTRQKSHLRVLLTFAVVMSWPLMAEATPTSFVAEYVKNFGEDNHRKYTYVEGLLNGTVNRQDGGIDSYSTPVVLIYPEDGDGNDFGWVDMPVGSYFLLYPDAFCRDPANPCPADQEGRLLEDQILQASRAFSEDFLFERGYVYMSIQYNKYITENFGSEPPPEDGGRRRLAYGTIPSGSNAYTIVQDASRFLRNPAGMFDSAGKNVSAPEAVNHVIGSAFSHAAWFVRGFLRQGFNRAADGTFFYDGMLHIGSGRFCRHALDVSPYIPSSGTGLNCAGVPAFQDQLDGKLILLQSETDLSNFSGDQARVVDPQHPSYRVYEMAGVAHIPQPVRDLAWLGAYRQNPTDARPFFRAAIEHLHDWIAEGKNPPSSLYIDGQRQPSGWVFNVDADGNATGGIRPPSMPSTTQGGEAAGAPTGVYGGIDATFPSSNPVPSFGGAYTRFSDEELIHRYPTEDSYRTLVTRAADQLLADEYILEEDRDRYIEEAKKADLPKKKDHP